VIPAWLAGVAAFFWGATWGSFGNVVVWRWPRGESLARPGSRCPTCGEPIRWFDNVPVLSWILLGGRCRDCRTTISTRYPLVEAACGLLAVAVWHRLAMNAVCHDEPIDRVLLGRFLIEFQVLWGLAIVSLVDLETLLVPDAIVLPLVVLALLGQALFPGGHPVRNLIAAAAGYLVVHLVFVIGWRLLTGREGMGLGDGKILALLGAHLGPWALPFVLFAGAMQGLLYVVVVMGILKRSPTPAGADEDEPADSIRAVKVPFGPFLALGALEAVFLLPLLLPRLEGYPIVYTLLGGV
jgi:leader peptidase (prepilin peptidase)/N-methyltransferase